MSKRLNIFPANVIEENAIGVGAWGGTCECPDGNTYLAGDNWDRCNSLACINGKMLSCYEKIGGWSERKVTCSFSGDLGLQHRHLHGVI